MTIYTPRPYSDTYPRDLRCSVPWLSQTVAPVQFWLCVMMHVAHFNQCPRRTCILLMHLDLPVCGGGLRWVASKSLHHTTSTSTAWATCLVFCWPSSLEQFVSWSPKHNWPTFKETLRHIYSVAFMITNEMFFAALLFVCVCVSRCVSVCPRAYLRSCWTDLHDIFVQIPCGCGSVLLSGVAICYVLPVLSITSCLAVVGRMAIPGRSLMSMNALFVFGMPWCSVMLGNLFTNRTALLGRPTSRR